jgi:hypothetical protein
MSRDRSSEEKCAQIKTRSLTRRSNVLQVIVYADKLQVRFFYVIVNKVISINYYIR